LKVLHSITNLYLRAFIIVDALDECQVADGCRTRFITEIFSLQAKTKANFFATSRFIPEITEKFKGDVVLEIRATNEDVKSYINSNMSQLPVFVQRNPDLQEEIKTEIIKAVDGI
jgi:hypothetical protein